MVCKLLADTTIKAINNIYSCQVTLDKRAWRKQAAARLLFSKLTRKLFTALILILSSSHLRAIFRFSKVKVCFGFKFLKFADKKILIEYYLTLLLRQ